MKIKYVLIFLMLAANVVANAQDVDIKQMFEQELKSKNENVNTIQCRFTQSREMSVLANTVTKEGDFYFQRPGDMLLLFDDGDNIKMTQEWFEMKVADNVTTTKVSSNPMFKNISKILSACVVGDFEQISKGFATDIEQTEQEWILTLKPQQGKAASKIKEITIHFDNVDMSLNILKMVEKSGDYTMYSFTQKQFNVTIDSELFKILK